MIPQEFEYFAPATLQDALELLSGPGTRPLAGGMSLVPLMKLRLAAPEKLVDLRRISSLRSIRREDSFLRIGAMVTHYEIESAPLILRDCPLLAATAAVRVTTVPTVLALAESVRLTTGADCGPGMTASVP